MKKKINCLILILLLFLLSACSSHSGQNKDLLPSATQNEIPSDLLPTALDALQSSQSISATLYFRFHQQPYLASEIQKIAAATNESLEKQVAQALVSGPSGTTTELASLFPEQTQVINTISQGNTLLITFSSGLLSPYGDVPEGWQHDDFWRQEVPLRRKLAMDSLAASIMETFRYDTIQVLVEPTQDSTSSSMRLQNSYYQDASLLNGTAPALVYDTSSLLTPSATSRIILSAWENKDWENLYPYISTKDHWDLSFKPTFEQIRNELASVPALIKYAISDASPSGNRQFCSFGLSFSTQSSPEASTVHKNTVFRLIRENNIWKISFSDLRILMGYASDFQGDAVQ